jgi:release factor glutamine methyltransferase
MARLMARVWGDDALRVSHTGSVAARSAVRSEAIERLTAAGCVAAEEEADELVALCSDDDTLEVWIRRRERGEPLAWITGSVQFCGHTVRIDPGVYVPRPQSEELARRASVVLGDTGGRAADLCTGSGAIAQHLMAASSSAVVVGVDIDVTAVRCARRNGARALVGDLGASLGGGAFDVVTAVAPYVPTAHMALLAPDVRRHEPRIALAGGGDGLDVVRRVVAEAARLLRPGGWLLVELGGEQDRALAPTLDAYAFGPTTTWLDSEGDLRGLAAQASAL